jgi:5'-3' exonuclease
MATRSKPLPGIRVHLVDGTYELFRHFFGAPPHGATDGKEVGATRGVLSSVLSLLADGATHVGVATDHVIESFRNDLWPGYKTGSGVDPLLIAQFGLLEESLAAMGVVVWPMVDLEADDALAPGAPPPPPPPPAAGAGGPPPPPGVVQVVICTPDKDLGQCVVADRVVQLDRRKAVTIDAAGVLRKFGVPPASIPDYLALVGDSADGFPGLAGWGKVSAATALARYGHLESIPDDVEAWDPAVRQRVRGAASLATRLATERDLALLFRDLATLRVDRSLLAQVEGLRWRGPTPGFVEVAAYLRDPDLLRRAAALAEQR